MKLHKNIAKKGGRNNQGITTNLHRGGGSKQIYRIIDFKRNINIGQINTIEKDPYRTAFISKISFGYNYYYYIITPEAIEINDIFMMRKQFYLFKTSTKSNLDLLKLGSAYNLNLLKIGTIVHNVELYPGKGGQIVRAAGNYAQIVQFINNKLVKLKLSSKKFYTIPIKCKGTIGIVSNKQHKNKKLKRAGQTRWNGKRPCVRGVAKNPIDHPHGGGQGKTSGGRISVTPWGKLTKGKKTRKNKRLNPSIQI